MSVTYKHTNFECFPRRINKSVDGSRQECTYVFGESEPYKEVLNTSDNWVSTAFDTSPIVVKEKKIPRSVSNTYRETSNLAGKDEVPSEGQTIRPAKNRDHNPKDGEIFGPPIPAVRSCPVNLSQESTVFLPDAEIVKPKEKERIETHTDSFQNGSYLLSKKDDSKGVRDSNTFKISKGMSFATTNYAERSKRRTFRANQEKKNPEMEECMKMSPVKPPNEVRKQRKSNTYSSQILGCQKKAPDRPASRVGVSRSTFETGGCTLPDGKKGEQKIYSSNWKMAVMTSKKHNAKKTDSIVTAPYHEPVKPATPVQRPRSSRPPSRITHSTVFDHFNQPTPNTAKKGYGRVTESSIFK